MGCISGPNLILQLLRRVVSRFNRSCLLPDHDRLCDYRSTDPHYIHGTARSGHYVYYERPGLANFPHLTKTSGLTHTQILRHYIFISEYVYTVLCPEEEAKMVSIWDITGVGMNDLIPGGDTYTMMKSMIKVMQTHYPERSAKLFIINAPRWFTRMWTMIRPLLDANTVKKIDILGTDFLGKLTEYIDPIDIPQELGGSSTRPLGQSIEEAKLAQFVSDNLNGTPASQAEGAGGGASDNGSTSGGSELSSSAVTSVPANMSEGSPPPPDEPMPSSSPMQPNEGAAEVSEGSAE